MTNEQIQSELRLFKAYTLEGKPDTGTVSNYLDGVQSGIIFKPSKTLDGYRCIVPSNIVKQSLDMYGIKPEQYNETLHKSFKVIKESSLEQLVLDQVIHYITTYGFESLGIYDSSTVYIPSEKLEIPELQDDIYLTVIQQITEKQLSTKLLDLITSGIALSEQTVSDVMCLSDYIRKKDFKLVTNREVKAKLYDKYDMTPSDGQEFVRYLINKLTGQSLLIKNRETIHKLKNADTQKVHCILTKYIDDNGYVNISQVFLRYKDLLLALKRTGDTPQCKQINKIINKISKLSHTYHKPQVQSLLDNITHIYTTRTVDELKEPLLIELDNCTVFREIRILNALRHRQNKVSKSYVYKIRNGKAFVSQKIDTKLDDKVFKQLYELIYNHLIERIKPNIEGKTFFIPSNVTYKAPTSEKQFTGNIPEGSCVQVHLDSNMVIGVFWNNILDDEGLSERVDLDLKIRNKSESYGWNTSYRSYDRNFMFSGDITDAENGATEAFFIGKNCDNKAFTVTLNKYTRNEPEVPFKLFIASTEDENINSAYVVDPNKIIVSIDNKFDKCVNPCSVVNEITLGLVKIEDGIISFYFNDFTTGSAISSDRSFVTDGIQSYIKEYTENQISLSSLITDCGGNIICTKGSQSKYTILDVDGNTKEISSQQAKELTDMGLSHLVKEELTEFKPDYDLSLENISKDTLIKLLTPTK